MNLLQIFDRNKRKNEKKESANFQYGLLQNVGLWNAGK